MPQQLMLGMGCRKYHEQMEQDELQYPNHRITDDNILLQIWCFVFPQSTSNLDESPAYFGGRNNCWRRLSLQNFPGITIIYAIMDYAQSKTLSDRLKKELKFLLLRPQNKELWHDRLLAVSSQFHEFKSPRDQSVAREEWEYEAGKLYAWSWALSREDIGQFPSTADAQIFKS
ncbi:uncharacterized protein CXorf58 homolog [Morus bassanus]